MINENDECLGLVINCAVRYALGRQTYVPKSVADFITPLIPKLDNKTLWALEKDIRESEGYGDELIDKPIWMNLLHKVQAELKKRKE